MSNQVESEDDNFEDDDLEDEATYTTDEEVENFNHESMWEGEDN